METEFIYWRHPTPVGIKVEEISGMENKSGKLWRDMAMQIYCENGVDGFREIGHFANGAPFLFGLTSRISITHTAHLLAVATLPKTPEANLSQFAPRTAMGIDAERLDREQVLRVRDKFLSDEEKAIVSEDSLEANIIAWTSKEALYKAAMTEGLDFRNDITIKSLPAIDRQMNLPGAPAPVIGKAQVLVADMRNHQDESPATEIRKEVVEMELYSYESEGCCVTIAYSPKCAKFGRKASKA
ncbi:4'-phosphopantetheinyl transferase family protein [Lepagella muris]|jgi:phosphopantetheinyl transferase (holo-ACP synthase)|uniref:4-phosphopantetheinyl transferase family protein n=1 Tax=Lepagella muris TaxID=3032870 RepID=A0AC61RF85_9BACT|nr:4'-phosphopantetheinyl transferase superfamily protein [Lepagella muris]ROT04623.1 4-phosphopantetheinyl transferase family protein [Muribaculaceae bacterium Isolate-037 (Harlan)]TGY79328.1 4-phosphopantetheinyl transferase family protein [Lepagella muris]THG52595.1 4-phosphopantetheinyl transferase family protein [Bacteroidales bacterium]TKC62921.1 4-phosphopantetheinyl transferase family protein [Bacteroidales bacterium]